MSKEKNKEIIDGYDYLAASASANDCTGLIPAPADSFEKREAYQAIHPFQASVNHKKAEKDKTPSK